MFSLLLSLASLLLKRVLMLSLLLREDIGVNVELLLLKELEKFRLLDAILKSWNAL